MRIKELGSMVRQAGSDFVSDDAMTLGGALAFYTALSLAPLLVILLSLASFLGESTQDRLVQQIEMMVGPQAGEGIQVIIDNAETRPDLGSFAGIAGLLTLLFSATGVFAQLQAALNRIWDVRARPSQGIWAWLRKRFLSLGMLLALGFLLLVSLAVSAGLGIILPQTGVIWQVVTFLVSMVVFVAMFALMFKYLPDVKITWNSVWAGAVLTAVLFAVGKFAIGLYLGHSSVASSYGAAGSLLLLLLWVYYSALIVFFGAELTQVYAHRFDRAIQPDEHAEWQPEATRPGGQERKDTTVPAKRHHPDDHRRASESESPRTRARSGPGAHP